MAFEFKVAAPKGWKQVRLDEDSRSTEVKKIMKNVSPLMRAEGIPPHLFQDFFDSSLSQVWDTGIRVLIVSQPSNEDAFQLYASFTIGVLPLAVPGADEKQNFEKVISTQMNERTNLFEDETLDISSYQHPQLGEGVEIRSIRYIRAKDMNSHSHKLANLQIFLIYHDRFIVLTGSTFQSEFSDIIFELFEKISNSVEVAIVPD